MRHHRGMPLLIALVVVAGVGWAAHARFAPAVVLRERTLAVVGIVRRYVVHAPATMTYLFVVSVTAWVLATSEPEIDDALLQSHSSNLAALTQSPIRGLIQSAFWVDGTAMLVIAWVLGLALVPVERWLGTRRWLVVFALGHVVTTLVVAAIMWGAIRVGWIHAGVRHVVDVGVSYGFGAVAGVLTFRFSSRAGHVYALIVFVGLCVVLAVDRDFTSVGHIIAFAVGLGCVALTRNADMRVRARTPYFALDR